MKRKTIIQFGGLLLCLLLSAMPIHAQGVPEFISASTHDPSVRSPQVEAFIRHDNLPVNLNTGGINLEIPLVDWKDKNFECPVSISYNSAGFCPREQDNFVGRNWMLNAGGVIYRKVNGVPDDIDWSIIPISADAGPGNYEYANGFLRMLGKNRFSRDEMSRDYRTNPYKYAGYLDDMDCLPFIPGTNDIEASADIFYFSFGKHSGKFMINFDGSVSASGNNGGKYKVDLSGMKIFNSTTPQDTRIRIMTDDGYVYTFGGGGYSSLEYNALAWKSFFYPGDISQWPEPNEISAYYLTEIQAPNGRKLTIKYKDDVDEEYHKKPKMLATLYEKPVSIIKKNALQYSLSGRSKLQAYRVGASDFNFEENQAYQPEPDASFALTKVVLIDYISTDNCTVSFTYSTREMHTDYGNTISTPENFPYICGAKLDEVTLTCRSYTETAQLDYTYMCGNRMFLNSVKNREGRYSFRYNDYYVDIPPTPLTYNIDHWGFWRGMQKNSGIIPRMKLGTYFDQDYIITSNDRDATGECYDYTLLREITYPTGGYTRFEYEPHWYSSIPQHTHTSNYYAHRGYPDRVQDALAGGVRMKSVTHYEQQKAVKKTIYTYGYKTMMGELMYMPYYRYLAHWINFENVNIVNYISFDSEGITDIPYPSVHIRYPEVTEHYVNPTANDLTEKHPYKTTEFVHGLSTINNYQNDFSYATTSEANGFRCPATYFKYEDIRQYNRNLLAHPTVDVSLKYGKVQKEIFYNEENQPVQQTDYEYSYLNKDKCAFRIYAPGTHFGLRTGLYTHIINEPFYEYALVKKITSRYTPGNNRAVRQIPEWYEYDKDGYLLRHSVLESGKDSLISSYTRIQRSSASRIQVLPVKQSLCIAGPNKNLLLKQDTVSYTVRPSLGLRYIPHRVTSLDGNGREQSVKEFIVCDDYGNPVEVMTNRSERVIYLWGYYGRHLIAQIRNATCAEVENALGMSPVSLSLQTSTISIISGLQARLPKAQVYTYTHHPYAGISSETAPDGKTTCYDYDGKGRLVKSYRIGENGKQEILQLNNYHIINE